MRRSNLHSLYLVTPLTALTVMAACKHEGTALAPITTPPSSGAAAVAGSAAAGSAAPVQGGSGTLAPVPPAGSAGAAGASAGPAAAATAGRSALAAGSGGQVAAAGGGAAGTAGSGAAGSAGDMGAGAGGVAMAAGSGGRAVDSRPFPAISFSGLVTAVELAPVRLAATGIYPARITVGSGGVDNLFAAGGALVASNAETQALRASVQHPNLRIIFTICEGLYRIVAKRSAGIATLADLRGKRIAVPAGTSSNYFLTKMLALAQLTERDITVVNQSPGMGALAADAATIWEPGIQYVSDNLKSDAIEFQKDDQGGEVYRELFNLHATAESLSDPDKRRTIVEFVRSLITASQQIRTDPSVVWPVLTGPTQTSQAVLMRSLAYERFAGTLVSDLLDVLAEEEVWRAQVDGRSPRTRDQLAKLIDDSVLMEASAP